MVGPMESAPESQRDRTVNVKSSETELVHNSMAILDALGVRCWRRNVVGRPWVDKRGRRRVVRSGDPSQSDIWGVEEPSRRRHCKGGRHWEVEIKIPGKEPELEQWLWLREQHELASVAFWCDSTRSLELIARCILEEGGNVVWLEGAQFQVELPTID